MENQLFKNKFRIKSIRLPNRDYSSDGAYYITICTKNRECFLGEIINGKMVLSEMGKTVTKFWYKIPQYFGNVVLDEFVIMPDHVHGIVIINNEQCRDAINRVSTKIINEQRGGITKNHNPMLSKSLSTIIRWYKGRSSYEINKIQNKIYFAWQTRFHERIIRNEHELNIKRKYIINNPINWELGRDGVIPSIK